MAIGLDLTVHPKMDRDFRVGVVFGGVAKKIPGFANPTKIQCVINAYDRFCFMLNISAYATTSDHSMLE
jgi:hypothetical protein